MTDNNASKTNVTLRALSGIRVLDFTAMIVGPYCTRWMADLGADVIKVEPPEGDYMRQSQPIRDGHSAYFGHVNCGKRSVAFDLKRPSAIATIRRLAAVSDVVVENFRPGVMKRLGLDYEALSAENPRLVYCSISGYGQAGPGADRPSYAPIVHAASGLDLALLKYQDSHELPANTGVFFADVLGAAFAAFSIQAALVQRERTGVGQSLDVTLMESALSMLVYELQEAQFPQEARRHVYKPLRAKDGFVIVTPINQKNFENLSDAIGHSEWKSEDKRFASVVARRQNWDQMMGLVEEWTQTRTAIECEEILMKAGVPCSRYANVREVLDDPHLRWRESFASVEDPAGSFLTPNPPFKMSRSATGAGTHVPSLGEHTVPVLRELLQFGSNDLQALQDDGAIAIPSAG